MRLRDIAVISVTNRKSDVVYFDDLVNITLSYAIHS